MASVALATSTSALVPVAAGNYNQWTPSTGTSHFALVDETPCNGLTDSNSTTVVGSRDSYAISSSSVPNGATITQIAIKPCASRVTSGGANSVMNVFYRLNGVNSADSGAYSLSGTTPVELATTTYSGLSTVKMASTTLEIGAVLTSSTKGARLSRIAAVITYTELTAPTTLVSTATSTSDVYLTWTDTSSNESGFTIDRSTDAVNWTAIATTSADVTAYNDAGRSPSTTYYHRVRAYNVGAYTSYSNTASSTTAAPAVPADPSALSATASQTAKQIALSWTNNSSSQSANEVLRSLDGISFSHLASTTATSTSYTDTSVAAATTYYYQVRAYNTAGYSGVSNTASDTTADVPAVPTMTSATTVTGTSTSQIDLVWADNSGNENNFFVERSTVSSTTGFAFIAVKSANVTTHTDTNISTTTTTYYYRVYAANGYGNSAKSNVVSAVAP
jgi:predicted phage tail protein